MNDASLKARIRNIAKTKKIPAQAILQNYLMQRFLLRLSLTEYKDKFVIKGGMLISSIVGVEYRSTMDIDTTLRNLPLTESSIQKAFETICSIKNTDGIVFNFESINPIRDNDEYGGYRVSFSAKYGKINAAMSMDISTGDIITPEAKINSFTDMFDSEQVFELWTYNIETVLAEKIETILSRGIDNTRPRDFYDVCVLSAYNYDRDVFKKAFEATSIHRGSLNKTANYRTILSTILDDIEMNKRWNSYSLQMPYANGITFKETIESILTILD